MKLFDIKRSCEKCGYSGRVWEGLVYRAAAKVEYVPEQTALSNGDFVTVSPEFLLRTCKQCGYKWKEACVDD